MRRGFRWLRQVRSVVLGYRGPGGSPQAARRKRLGLQVEPLEARLLLHGNPVLDAEHLAVFGKRDPVTGVLTGGLLPDSDVTYKSVQSGNWSDPGVWLHVGSPGDGTLPGPDANVLVTEGTTVTIDGDEAVQAGKRVALRIIRDDGLLRFDPTVNTRLLVDTMIVEPWGQFEMGTATTPIDAGHTARVIFADREIGLNPSQQEAFEAARRDWDPLEFSLGLISHGQVNIYGAPVTSDVLAPGALAVGATSVNLGTTAPTGWKVGDRLIVTGDTATNAQDVNQDEQVAIAGINGGIVTFSAPMKYLHVAGTAYIADVTRNAVFESETVDIIARRGHTMFMHSPNVHIDGAGFYGLGRTDKRTPIDDPVQVPDTDHPGKMTTDVLSKDINKEHPELGHRILVPVLDAAGNQVKNPDGTIKLEIARTGLNPRGRYAVHFHRTGVDPGDGAATVTDIAVVDSPGWGIVNHSSNVDVSYNVVFNAVGAAYVTEAGDELGTFDHNIAIHSQGSGNGIDSRKNVQDFGHEGDGFWLQGGNVSVTNNVVTGQRHSGYVFFPVGLDQKGLGVTTIDATNLVDPSWAKGKATVAVGDVPLRQFQGNIALACSDGFESWFSLLNVTDGRRTVVQDFTVAYTRDGGVFTPYTNDLTLKNVLLAGDVNNPHGTAFARNNVTRNIIYDHVHAGGWAVGIDAPVNGSNTILGGTFNNLKNILISTANSRDRTVAINDASASDPIVFLDNLVAKDSHGKITPRQQFDVYLTSNFHPEQNDITRLFNRDVITMGTVTHNGQQLYYLEQAADFVPFDTSKPGLVQSFVPQELRNKTNQQLWDQYGLAVGNIVAPASATASDPKINALIGPPSTYRADLNLISRKYSNDLTGYKLSYQYVDQSQNALITVKELSATPLTSGWNLLTRTVQGVPRTLLVYGDNTPPSFVVSASMPLVINKADLDNGVTFFVQGSVVDDSFGQMNFVQGFQLNDAKHVSALQTRADGSTFVTLTFTITDFAGNSTVVKLDLTVTSTAPLQSSLGRKNLPTIIPSETLLKLLLDGLDGLGGG
jgi:hypothetical protein